MISIQHLSKCYPGAQGDVVAFSDINLDIAPAEIFGIIGRSGAGKSSLMRCLNLLSQPTRGRIVLDGEDLTALNAHALRNIRRQVGVVFQHDCLVHNKTVLTNVMMPLVFQGATLLAAKEQALHCLSLVGLTEKHRVFPKQLSGGQRQRVAIARALVTSPKVLLCDEPTSALDPETTRQLLQVLKDIRQTLGVTIVCITHDMQVVQQICDRVAVLEKGKVVECKITQDLFSQPETQVAKELVHHAVNDALPEAIKSRLSSKMLAPDPLWRLVFKETTASRAVIAEVSCQFAVALNILQANLSIVHNESMGFMLVEVIGESAAMEKAKMYLQSLNIGVEVLAYVD
ncbi:MAG: methionine import ATP-binding protein MetN [marine bacterium B5-7]|nr:MAG: methionine import ATP-binding protein MetN [marine bacterium B5-7]